MTWQTTQQLLPERVLLHFMRRVYTCRVLIMRACPIQYGKKLVLSVNDTRYDDTLYMYIIHVRRATIADKSRGTGLTIGSQENDEHWIDETLPPPKYQVGREIGMWKVETWRNKMICCSLYVKIVFQGWIMFEYRITLNFFIGRIIGFAPNLRWIITKNVTQDLPMRSIASTFLAITDT